MTLKARCSKCNSWAISSGASLICSCGTYCSAKTGQSTQGTLPTIPVNPFEEARIIRNQTQQAFSNMLVRVRRKSDAWSRLKALTGGCIHFSKMNRDQCQHVMSGIEHGSFSGI